MPSYQELKKGVRILFHDQPYEITESSLMFRGRGHSTLSGKMKNLITGETLAITFQPSDSFDEPDIENKDLKFLYSHKDEFIFCLPENSGQRFTITRNSLGESHKFLKVNEIIEGLFFEEKLVNVKLPIKVILKVKEAPPAIKGQSAQGGTKPVVLETGSTIDVPLFVNEGDLLEINTETGEYVSRQ